MKREANITQYALLKNKTSLLFQFYDTEKEESMLFKLGKHDLTIRGQWGTTQKGI